MTIETYDYIILSLLTIYIAIKWLGESLSSSASSS